MTKSRYTEAQIHSILRQAEGGGRWSCREPGMRNASLHNWRAKSGGMPSERCKHHLLGNIRTRQRPIVLITQSDRLVRPK